MKYSSELAHRTCTRLVAVLGCGLSLSVAMTGCITRNPNLETGLRQTEAGIGTAPTMPGFAESDEATAEQLERARDQGNAERRELEWVSQHSAASAEMTVGEYRVAYILGPALGYYAPGSTTWNGPSGDAHLGIAVRDAADGRMVPGLTVRATLTDAAGRQTDSRTLAFGWYDVLNRYGDNVALPAGPFTLRVVIQRALYRRHDPTNGDRYADSAVAEFHNVSVNRGRIAQLAVNANTGTVDSTAAMLAKLEGAALERPLVEMFSSVGVNGTQTRVGDYLAVVAIERAEGYWIPQGNDIKYTIRVSQSAETNAHVEVGVRDALTGRFLPGLNVRATVLDRSGHEIGTKSQPFMWHPWIHHYGENWRVPSTGRYNVRAHADVPPYRRYSRSMANLFLTPVDVEIPNLRFVTGQK